MISCGSRLAPFDIPQLREVMSYDELGLDKIGDRKTAVFFTISDTTPTYNFIVALAFSQMFNLPVSYTHLDVYKRQLPDYGTGRLRLYHASAGL